MRQQRLALAFGCALALGVCAVAEIAARIIAPQKPSLSLPDPILNHTWRPNSDWTHDQFAALGVPPYTHHYNKQAWLERYDVAQAKPAGTYRIFYVGDSFTEGTCPMERSMPSLVEEALRPRFEARGLRLEVINAGTSSYSPTLYYLLLRHRLLAYDPDLIVVNIDMTDVFDDWLYRDTALYDEQGRPIACPPKHRLKGKYIRTADGLLKRSWKGQLVDAAREHSRAFDLLVTRLPSRTYFRVQKTAETADPSQPTNIYPATFAWCLPDWTPETEAQVAASMSLLREVFRLAKAHDIRIAATAVPHLRHFQPVGDLPRYSTRPLEEVERACRAEGVPYLDSFLGVQERLAGRDPAELYIPTDPHFNEHGYALWAEAQEAFLLQRDHALLPAEVLESVTAHDTDRAGGRAWSGRPSAAPLGGPQRGPLSLRGKGALVPDGVRVEHHARAPLPRCCSGTTGPRPADGERLAADKSVRVPSLLQTLVTPAGRTAQARSGPPDDERAWCLPSVPCETSEEEGGARAAHAGGRRALRAGPAPSGRSSGPSGTMRC